MNKTIITIIIIAAGITGLMWWGKSIQKTTATLSSSGEASVLVASEKLYDFGTISMANGTVEGVFKITNPTLQDITLSKVETSCECTVAYVETAGGKKGPFGMPGHGGLVATRTNEVIKAGESLDIKVVYDPNAHGPAGVGSIVREVYLTDNAERTLILNIKAMVTP